VPFWSFLLRLESARDDVSRGQFHKPLGAEFRAEELVHRHLASAVGQARVHRWVTRGFAWRASTAASARSRPSRARARRTSAGGRAPDRLGPIAIEPEAVAGVADGAENVASRLRLGRIVVNTSASGRTHCRFRSACRTRCSASSLCRTGSSGTVAADASVFASLRSIRSSSSWRRTLIVFAFQPTTSRQATSSAALPEGFQNRGYVYRGAQS
jgi:hypothetical protein